MKNISKTTDLTLKQKRVTIKRQANTKPKTQTTKSGNTDMKFIQTTASVILAGIVASLAAPAFAGTTTNTWTNGTERGTTKVKVNNVRVETGDFHRLTENLKIDAVTEPGGFAQSSINVQNGVFNGSGIANINNGVDPYVNAGRSLNIENGSFSDITTTKVNQNTDSFNRVRSHSLDTSF